MSPSIASSPIRSTFPETKALGRGSPAPTNGGRPATSRARQNSTQSVVENARQRESSTSKQNGNSAGTPDLAAAATVTGKTIPEVKASMKETASNSKGEHMLEDVDKEDPEVAGAVVVGNKKDAVTKREEPETNGDSIQSIQVTTVTTKSGRASKPSTPAISQFPDPPVRSRSSRNTLEASNNKEKRSHKKGAGAAAQLIAQQNQEVDDAGSTAQEDEDEEEIGADEPLYCYCNGVSYGEMVACDADDCEKEWFHLECVGLKVPPKTSGKLMLFFPVLLVVCCIC